MVARWDEVGVLFLALRRFGDLYGGSVGRKSEAHYRIERPRRFAGVESQDGRTNRMGERADRTSAGLHHGSGRHQCAAAYGPGLCGVAELVAERTVSGALLDAALR